MKYFCAIVLIFSMVSCNTKEKTDAGISADHEIAEPKKQRESAAELNQKNRVHPYPQILSESLNGLDLVHNAWESRFILCGEYDFLNYTQISSNSIVAFLRKPANQYSFAHIQLDGQILSENIIDEPHQFSKTNLNFKIIDNEVHFYVQLDSIEYLYDLQTRQLKIAKKKLLDWTNIMNLNWQLIDEFNSPSGRYEVDFNGGTDLILKDHDSTMVYDLIKQEYLGNWSFGTCTWSTNENCFYFDNSGAVACIWEVNIKEMTLDKIVPEHHAGNPIYLTGTTTPSILYEEDGCLKIVERKEKLTSLFSN